LLKTKLDAVGRPDTKMEGKTKFGGVLTNWESEFDDHKVKKPENIIKKLRWKVGSKVFQNYKKL